MVTPLNTTTKNEPYCVRELTRDNVLDIISLNGTSGICPGTRTSSGHYRCCRMADTCLGYGMCYRENAPSGRTGFYVGGCNDANYGDGVACQKICAGEARPDVVWEADLGVWRCCGTDLSGRVDCYAPALAMDGATFLAPGPDVLMGTGSNETVDGVVMGAVTVTGTQVTATPTSTATATATGTGSAGSSGGHGLSGVATGGIAVGVIVPLVLLGVVGFFFMQRRRAKKSSEGMEMKNMRRWHQ